MESQPNSAAPVMDVVAPPPAEASAENHKPETPQAAPANTEVQAHAQAAKMPEDNSTAIVVTVAISIVIALSVLVVLASSKG